MIIVEHRTPPVWHGDNDRAGFHQRLRDLLSDVATFYAKSLDPEDGVILNKLMDTQKAMMAAQWATKSALPMYAPPAYDKHGAPVHPAPVTGIGLDPKVPADFLNNRNQGLGSLYGGTIYGEAGRGISGGIGGMFGGTIFGDGIPGNSIVPPGSINEWRDPNVIGGHNVAPNMEGHVGPVHLRDLISPQPDFDNLIQGVEAAAWEEAVADLVEREVPVTWESVCKIVFKADPERLQQMLANRPPGAPFMSEKWLTLPQDGTLFAPTPMPQFMPMARHEMRAAWRTAKAQLSTDGKTPTLDEVYKHCFKTVPKFIGSIGYGTSAFRKVQPHPEVITREAENAMVNFDFMHQMLIDVDDLDMRREFIAKRLPTLNIHQIKALSPYTLGNIFGPTDTLDTVPKWVTEGGAPPISSGSFFDASNLDVHHTTNDIDDDYLDDDDLDIGLDADSEELGVARCSIARLRDGVKLFIDNQPQPVGAAAVGLSPTNTVTSLLGALAYMGQHADIRRPAIFDLLDAQRYADFFDALLPDATAEYRVECVKILTSVLEPQPDPVRDAIAVNPSALATHYGSTIFGGKP